MKPTLISKREDGSDIRIGWASWDKGNFESKSIKFAYKDGSGKISRGSPEVPFDVLIEMVIFAYEQGELSDEQTKNLKHALNAG